ncbi:MAG: lipid-A-disaccharide synthase [Candidatus Coatesbacteria bacterium]
MRPKPLSIFISAGEPSGDIIAALLARELRRQSPGVRLHGFGGPKLAAAGARVDTSLLRGAVMGGTGLVRHLHLYWSLIRNTARTWRTRPPSAVVLIDFPGFNFRVGKIAHRLGIPVYYYVCPQVWAWAPNRLLTLREIVRRSFPVLPFEEPLHQAFGIRAMFPGHPLLEVLPQRAPDRVRALRAAGLNPGRPVAALLPGSREGEIERILPVQLAAARRIAVRQPALQWAVIAAPGARPHLAPHLTRAAASGLPVHMVLDAGYGIRAHARFAWTASGTSSLELGLLGVPQVVMYRTSAFNWAIGSRVLRIPWVSLVNLLFDRGVVTELLQGALTPDALVRASAPFVRGEGARVAARRRAAELRRMLAGTGASRTVAATILKDFR